MSTDPTTDFENRDEDYYLDRSFDAQERRDDQAEARYQDWRDQ